MTIIAISRGTKYSPNHICNDAAIYNKVVEELCHIGFTVIPCTEEEFVQMPLPDTAVTVVTMARDGCTISRLLEWEAVGAVVINSPQGVLNCVRRPMTEHLLQHGVPHPKSWILPTEEYLPNEVSSPCWIKRGDSHAIVKEDVCYAVTHDDVLRTMVAMKERGIPTVVINEHLDGDLVKFYGVQGDTFFHWFYPSSVSHSKFGLESINGQSQGLPFESNLLKQYADKAACILNVPVYGGDAVVALDGSIRIIDFNDFPSFAPCRDEAAKAIARRIGKCRS